MRIGAQRTGPEPLIPAPAVVVGIDGSGTSRAALEYGVSEAELLGLPLRLVHVVATAPGPVPSGPPVERRGSVISLRSQSETVFTTRYGSPIGELLASAGDGSWLVLGADHESTRGGRGVVAEAVVARARCPVTIVPRRLDTSIRARVLVLEDERHRQNPSVSAAAQQVAAASAVPLTTMVRPSQASLEEAEEQVRAGLGPGDLLVIGLDGDQGHHPMLDPLVARLIRAPRTPVLLVPASVDRAATATTPPSPRRSPQ